MYVQRNDIPNGLKLNQIVEEQMGNRYEQKICSSCKDETIHRIVRRFGKAKRGKGEGKMSIKRIVTWCMECQKRIIDNRRNKKSLYAI